MNTAIAFAKDAKLQNILFDEYFAEHKTIAIIAFNYNGNGTALCRCDEALAEIEKANLRKIIFGAEKAALEAYLLSIFDPDTDTDDIKRRDGSPIFRLPGLREMKKYDVANLAKKTLQHVRALTESPFHYYIKDDEAAPASKSGTPL